MPLNGSHGIEDWRKGVVFPSLEDAERAVGEDVVDRIGDATVALVTADEGSLKGLERRNERLLAKVIAAAEAGEVEATRLPDDLSALLSRVREVTHQTQALARHNGESVFRRADGGLTDGLQAAALIVCATVHYLPELDPELKEVMVG